jgi:AraC-like DNA-binding protein
VLQTKGASQPLRSNLFLAVGTRHLDEWQCSETLTAHFQFQTVFLEQCAAALGTDPGWLQRLGRLEVKLEESVESLCSCLMHEVVSGCRHGTAFFEALSKGLAIGLVRCLARAGRPFKRNPCIDRAVEFLERSYQDPIGLKQVAQVAGLSPCHFLRAFRAAVGVSPQAYLVRCRLRYAQRLMTERVGRGCLGKIAVEAGFCDQTHMIRHFRHAFGQTPGEWLRAQQ